MAKTLIILKPDCMAQKHAGAVIDRFEKEGFQICACKMMKLSSELLREHYDHVADKPFFPEIELFMSSRPVIVMALEGNDVIDRVRKILGPTNSKEAPAGSIRGDMGTDMMKNIAHASDSPEAAETEIKRFFAPEELYRP
jgi:nucleoside-diphosphate kinase